MSTEHQQYSIYNQSLSILQYAEENEMEIVRTYADHGKSGLNLGGRQGLQQLLNDVKAGKAEFRAVLVFDVSRFGRFQNPDEGAAYEYSLSTAGVPIHYCAEQFKNDGTLASAILKTLKRGMAGEFSRELSGKVWMGHRRLTELGFRAGGPAGYGLRRQLLDRDGNFKQVLLPGDRKSIQTDRVILVPGPRREIKIVREIYRLFLDELLTEPEIAQRLIAKRIQPGANKKWTRSVVRSILTNHKYIGSYIYNRLSLKLGLERTHNPPEEWIRKPNAIKPLVSEEVFQRVQELFAERSRRRSSDQLLAELRGLLSREGRLTAKLIESCKDISSPNTFTARFGSMLKAYSQVGFESGRNFQFIDGKKEISKRHSTFVATLIEELQAVSSTACWHRAERRLIVNGEYRVQVQILRCRKLETGKNCWTVLWGRRPAADIALIVRLNPENKEVMDYFVFPRKFFEGDRLALSDRNPIEIEIYRFDNLDYFKRLCGRTQIREEP